MILRRVSALRLRVAERFADLAAMREARAFGYGDQSDKWRATPAALRKAVDDYNAAPQHTKDRFIESLRREPERARAIDTLIEQRERAIRRDREGRDCERRDRGMLPYPLSLREGCRHDWPVPTPLLGGVDPPKPRFWVDAPRKSETKS